MKKDILYLTKSDINQENGLVFPSEIENQNYYGIGSLYIADNILYSSYILLAVHQEEIIEVELTAKKNNFYTCFIHDIGGFTFYIEKLYKPLSYIGENTHYKDLNVHYRLRLQNTKKAAYFAMHNNFYFVGKSNITDEIQS